MVVLLGYFPLSFWEECANVDIVVTREQEHMLDLENVSIVAAIVSSLQLVEREEINVVNSPPTWGRANMAHAHVTLTRLEACSVGLRKDPSLLKLLSARGNAPRNERAKNKL